LIWNENTYGALLLIENGADVNAVGDMGQTPLHVAVGKENRAVIDALLKAGAKLDVISEFGKTALDEAQEKGIKL